MDIDINELRELEAMHHQFRLPNEKMTFYYDETANVRKFSLTEEGINDLNAVNRDFILGGVAFDGDACPANIDELYRRLRLQPTVRELKYDKLVNGHKDFWKGLNRNTLSEFLDWLCNSGLYIHYITLNNLYYSIVDIVDSLWDVQPQFCFSGEWEFSLKSVLYKFAFENQDDFYAVLKTYEYPDIKEDKIKDFCRELINLIEENGDFDDFFLECFRQMLKVNSKKEKMLFLQDNEKDVLVQEYFLLRIGRCYMFKNSFHYFDEEDEAELKMKEIKMLDGDKELLNYAFVDSKKDRLIQISDALIGLLGKFFEFIDNIKENEFLDLLMDATDKQKKNLKIIAELIDKAEKKHITLIYNVNDINLTRRRGKFLVWMENLNI
ncbi:hypothetical protein FDF50_12040 [Clostridium botulinum]|uniref:DUF3800 domain-containing protein n=1 Tax=Clostridium botulinum TaxID=1491 RepID=UPI0006A728AA|nr:DUF3800 domain-containing protein [Clostridium botulinum]KON10968.1 hypothetical protein ACP52_02380 [Clostridium botulinum]MBD5587427.1 hypothetical protein [Clostridium botulinum]MBO0571623.1 hypothetical protein [Clostridium botulinum]MBO0581608.1 hypothetical protein [Clostridium botulinum]MBY6904178.1 hypothetical protein [Clostridium botulinum]